MLLNLGANVETRSPKEAFTVLHIAIACNQERIIDLLLVHDSNIHARARVCCSLFVLHCCVYI